MSRQSAWCALIYSKIRASQLHFSDGSPFFTDMGFVLRTLRHPPSRPSAAIPPLLSTHPISYISLLSSPQANEKLAKLLETQIAPTTLRFVRNGKVVIEMEDQFYREDASRFRFWLRIMFSYLIGLALIFGTFLDYYMILQREGEQRSDEALRFFYGTR